MEQTLTVFKFKSTPRDNSLAVYIRASDLLDASRYMHLLTQLEPENYSRIDTNCVCALDGKIELPEAHVVFYDYPYPKVLREKA